MVILTEPLGRPGFFFSSVAGVNSTFFLSGRWVLPIVVHFAFSVGGGHLQLSRRGRPPPPHAKPPKTKGFPDSALYNDHYVKLKQIYPQIFEYFVCTRQVIHRKLWTSLTTPLWITGFGSGKLGGRKRERGGWCIPRIPDHQL